MVKKIRYLEKAQKELNELPETVREDFSTQLRFVERGINPTGAKPLTGKVFAGVMELVERYRTDTYRLIYFPKLPDAVYVLHVFKKKSVSGSKTPKPNLDTIERRLASAKQESERLTGRR